MKRIFLGVVLFFVISSSKAVASPVNCSLNIYPQPSAGTHRYTITLTNNSSVPAYYFSTVFYFGGQPSGQAANILSANSNYWRLDSVHGYDVTGSAGIPIANGSITYQVDLTSSSNLTGIDIGMASVGSPINDICSQGSGDYSITYNETFLSPTPIPEPTPPLPPITPTNCSLNIYPQPFPGTHRYVVTLTNNTSVPGYTFENNFWIDGQALGYPANVTSPNDWYIYAPNGSLSGMPSYQVKGTAGMSLTNNSSLTYFVDLTINNYFSGVDLGLSSYLASPIANNICRQGSGSYTITFNPPPTTPTPSPTMTPTPTSTPTPTQIPPPTNKVVVIPGVEGSWNQDALVNCKLDDYSGDWTLLPVAAAVYDPLLWNLDHAGWDVHVYNYDWRKQIVDQVSGFNNFVDGLTEDGEKVDVVGHSMGGLVGRAYLEDKKESSGVETFVSAGTPHKGTALAYPSWSAGELWKENLLDWFYVTLMQLRCQLKYGWSSREAIRNAFPAIQNLLPISDYLIDHKTGSFIPEENMDARNNWLPTEFFSPYYGVQIGTLSGKGKPTLESMRVKEANKFDKLLGDWSDGRPVRRINSKLGDGAILNSSSMIEGADNRFVNKDHIGLVWSQAGVGEILDLLGAPNAVPAIVDWIAPESLLMAVTDAGSPSIISPDGKETKGDLGVAGLINTGKGKYKFKAGQETKWMGVGKFRKDGTMDWKEYDYSDKKLKLEEVEFSE